MPELQPSLHTQRLLLRPFAAGDAPDVERLAGAAEIAATTLQIPHPYPAGIASTWIAAQAGLFEEREGAGFAVVEAATGRLCGCIGLGCDQANSRAELGYWIGVPFWGKGYATEAALRVVAFGFAYFGLNRIHACHFASNPASGRVMEKIGMRREGCRREAVFKPGRGYEDLVDYGILLAEWVRFARGDGEGV